MGSSALRDLDFLGQLRRSSLEELEDMLERHLGKSCPRWKLVAIRTAIARVHPCTRTWVQGLDELRGEERSMDPFHRRLLQDARERLGCKL